MVEIFSLTILIAYILLMLYAAYVGFRRTKAGRAEFFVASGTLGVIASFFTYVATWASAYAFIGLSTILYTYGIDWQLFEVMTYPFIIVPLTFIVAHRVWSLAKKYKYITPADLIVHRIGLNIPVRILFLIMAVYPFIFYMGIQFIGMSAIISGISGVPYHFGVILFTIVAIIIIALGGIRGIAYSDILMGVTFLALVAVTVILLPFYLGTGYIASAVEGPRGWIFKPSLPPQYVISALFLVSIPWAGLIPHLMTKLYAAQNDKAIYASALGIGVSGLLIYSLLPIFVGSALAYYWPELPKVAVTAREEYVTMFFSQLISPVFAMLLMLGLVAAAFSTILGIAITLTSIIHVDILEKTLKLKLSERTLDLIARLLVILVMLVGSYSAISPSHPIVRIAITLIWPGLSVIAFPILIALFWRRANKWGVFLGHLVGFLSLILFTYFIWPEWPNNPFYLWEGTLPTIIGIAVTFIVSLITPPEPEERLKEFFP
jgi:Na+/proline symporter